MVGTHRDLDQTIDAVRDSQRRHLLYALRETEPMEIEEAANRLATHDDHEHVVISLYHHHLPKLTDLGIIEYDQRDGTIRFDDPPEELESLLDLTQSLDEKADR